jgi:hypothetical protein
LVAKSDEPKPVQATSLTNSAAPESSPTGRVFRPEVWALGLVAKELGILPEGPEWVDACEAEFARLGVAA